MSLNKPVIIFLVFILLATAAALAAGNMFTATSDGTVCAMDCTVQSITLWAGTDGQSVIVYNGTGSSATPIAQLGGQTGVLLYHIDFPMGIIADKGVYADCSWSGTGTSDPRVYVGTD